MGDRDTGARAAIAETLGEIAERARPAEAEQLELIGVPADMLPEAAERARSSAARGRAGRPPGAQNVATREVKDFCRRVFGYDPMVEGFRWLQHTPESLALVLGCTKAEAFDRLEAIRRDLARYFYAPMQPIGEDGRPVPFFQMVIGGAANGAGAGAPPWDYAGGPPIVETPQNQALGAPQDPPSHDAPSHGDAK